jgi:hypothetical protein
MSGQVIQCPACSGDLRVPATADSEPTRRGARPDPHQDATAKSSDSVRKPEHHPATELSGSEINKLSSRSYHLKSEDEEDIEIHQEPERSNAPGSVSSLVLGILSIPLALVVGFFVALTVAFSNDDFVVVFHFGSLVAGILAIVQAGKANRAIQSSAGRYNGGGMAIAGMTCGIIGITIFLFFMFAILSEL